MGGYWENMDPKACSFLLLNLRWELTITAILWSFFLEKPTNCLREIQQDISRKMHT